MNLFIKIIQKNWSWFVALIPLIIIVSEQNPACTGYTHPSAKGIIDQIVRYKGLTRIVVRNEPVGNYGYFMEREIADSLALYAMKGDWFERVHDSIKIVKNNQKVTMWAIDTANWRCTCYSWQLKGL